jgi:hypothetical protein
MPRKRSSAPRPPFPIGLTLDEALARGWVPGKGRYLIAIDDGPIREATSDEIMTNYLLRRRQRRGPAGGVRAMIRATMERYKAGR